MYLWQKLMFAAECFLGFFCFFIFYSIHGCCLTLTWSWNAINEGRAGGWMWYTIFKQNNITAYLKAGLGLCFLFPQRLQNTSRIAPKSQLLLFPLNMEMVLLCFTLAFVLNSTRVQWACRAGHETHIKDISDLHFFLEMLLHWNHICVRKY